MPEAGVARPRPLHLDLIRITPDLVVAWDVMGIALAGCGSAYVYDALAQSAAAPDFLLDACRLSVVGGLISPLALSRHAARKAAGLPSFGDIVMRTLRQGAVLIGLLAAVGFLTRMSDGVPRLWVAAWVAAAFVALVTGRALLRQAMGRMMRRGLLADRVVLVGHGAVSDQLVRRIAGDGAGGVKLIQVFEHDVADGNALSERTVARLIAMGQRGEMDRVVLTSATMDEDFAANLILRLKILDLEVSYCPALPGMSGASQHVEHLAGLPIVVLTNRAIGHWGSVLKGLLDRVLAAVAIVLLAPLLAGLMIAVRLDSPGPVIFRQRRHGWNGTEFQIFKFRTMFVSEPSNAAGAVQTRRDDRRVTSVGRFLRSSSLDELPQLFNVLNGTMSLVGPRPHPVVMRTEQRLGEEIIAEYSHRHRVKPGITGWAQINGHRGATETAEQVRKRVEHDIHYIDNWSFLLDLTILVLTPYRVLFHRENSF